MSDGSCTPTHVARHFVHFSSACFDCALLQLAAALKGNTSLKVLDIGGNNIGPEGIKVLLEALRGNETLTTLELGYNPIGEAGAKHLADVLKYDLQVRLQLHPC